MRRALRTAACAGALGLSTFGAPTQADDELARGEYVFRAAGCCACHTDTEQKGAPLAGGRALESPFGVFYSPNITPHAEHGIGRWSEADFIRAMREGIGPQGQRYYPAFPYTSYTRLTDADLRALWRYLKSVPPVARPDRPHELVWYAAFRPALALWQWMYFTPGAFEPDPQRSEQWNRGAYLVRAAAHCSECHTPRDALGVPDADRFLAGNPSGPEGGRVPNITPDRKTGIGKWRESEVAYYLETGMDPSGDFAGSSMADVIDHGTKYLTKQDREAIAHYVLSLPPIEHAVKKEKKDKKNREFDY